MLSFWTTVRQSSKASALRRCLHSSSAVNATAAATEAGPSTTPQSWTPQSVRTGVIARKRGMTAMWDQHGAKFPVTVLQLDNCQVTANVKTVRKDNSEYHAVQVGASDRPDRTTTKAMRGHFSKAEVHSKYIVKEFPITADAHVPVGTTLSAIHFVPGQYVDVIAKSIGKGFQGGMKRWGFRGLRASHGVSVSHRKLGATGGHQDPGRVWPGKKMAGRMGGDRTTAQNLEVVRVDTALDLVFVKGCVPGVDDAHVMVRDAKKRMREIVRANFSKGNDPDRILPKGVDALPFPAGTKEMAETLPPIITAPSKRVTSPFAPASN
ncbi:mitochondrial 50S ribosomal protein L3 [Schizopora paradoxa]|uniref:Large ribosomal subunit protein uL3m n=1 Tax=Schizopora paradoxa TaxID=27342 RepID=A0A0H2RNG0_9AGAM|nr:mitochondrial 50S ribosomal protein L3 [Schizopora paradoxa]